MSILESNEQYIVLPLINQTTKNTVYLLIDHRDLDDIRISVWKERPGMEALQGPYAYVDMSKMAELAIDFIVSRNLFGDDSDERILMTPFDEEGVRNGECYYYDDAGYEQTEPIRLVKDVPSWTPYDME